MPTKLIAIIAIVALLGVVLFSKEHWLRKLIAVLGVAAQVVIGVMLWSGKISVSDIIESFKDLINA